MAVFKCKMCGGSLDIAPNTSVVKCEYCGVKQTLPRLDDEKRANFYDRANHYRRNNDFDKALSIYEQILAEDNTDAEAYWSIVLCRHGIVYVEDPATHKRIPTINRTQSASILADPDYLAALEHADGYQKEVYVEQATAIHEIQKGILAISQNEEPFDVFICYKESDSNGRRTPDSVLAQELYYELTEAGYRVFFARITLEDKLGSAYEPYIFAALQSAKVMVVLGTKSEYFEAVWVRNEWSRYLSLIQNGESKVLIPAYRDMDPYDLPREFSHLQAQDMSKLGFMQDLIRGIGKIAPKEGVAAAYYGDGAPAAPSNAMLPNYLKRLSMFVADGSFDDANEYCDKVLDLDPENADAYFYALLSAPRVHCKNLEELSRLSFDFTQLPQYQRAYRYADSARKAKLDAAAAPMLERVKAQGSRDQEEQTRARVNDMINRRRTGLSKLIQDKNRQIAESQKATQTLQSTYAQSHGKTDALNSSRDRRKQYGIATLTCLGLLVFSILLLILSINFFGFGMIAISLLVMFGAMGGIMFSYIELARQYFMKYALSTRITFFLLSLGIVGIYLAVKAIKGYEPNGTKAARQASDAAADRFSRRKGELDANIQNATEELGRLQAALEALPVSVSSLPMDQVLEVERTLEEDIKTSRYHVILLSCSNTADLAQELSAVLNVSPANAMQWMHSLPVCLVKNVSMDRANDLGQRIGKYGRFDIQLAAIQ